MMATLSNLAAKLEGMSSCRVLKTAVLSVDSFKTPRSVWVNSAIAAALLHSLLAWWGLAAWQERRVAIPAPAPIRLVTLPGESAATESSAFSSANDLVPASPAEPSSAAPGPVAPSPAAPSTDSAGEAASTPSTFPPVTPAENPSTPPAVTPTIPSTSAPPVAPPNSVFPQGPAPSTPPPQPPAAPSAAAPSSPAAPPSPTPSPPPPPTPPSERPPPPPSTPPPGESDPGPTVPPTAPPGELGSGESEPQPPEASEADSTGGIQSQWSLQQVPGGGSDIHDEIPRLPEGWQATTAALLENAGCASGLVAPGTSIQLTVWPTIDAQGRIMEFLPWEDNGGVPSAVVQCVEGLRSQLPPLIPAQDGGAAIASDEVLLVIEIRGTP